VRFGISTHLFHGERLARQHLAEIASHGFDAIELFATRTHFDYGDPASATALAEWLAGTGLRLHSVHAPIAEGYVGGVWGPTLSIASADRDRRAHAVKEAATALAVGHLVPFRYLVVHVGTPDAYASRYDDNHLDAARRSLEELHGLTRPLGVRLALEVIPNRLSAVDALLRIIDDDLDLSDAGLCLDFGHAHLMEGAADAIEAASGHLFTTHVHDNRGREDEHLVPFEGTIDWAGALFAAVKVGYDGPYVFEVADRGNPGEVLGKTRRAARRFEEILAM
jgi:sugar phosphate isomerase/epimerase